MRVALLLLAMLAQAPNAHAEKGSRRKDGGLVLSAGLELAITHVRITGPDRLGNIEGNITGAAILYAPLTMLQVDYNFTRYIGLGLRLGYGKIINSDNADTFHSVIGPTLTIYMGHIFYLGIDAWLQTFRFNDSPASVHGDDNAEEGFPNELSADAAMGFSFGLRFGLVFEVASIVTIAPEIRLGVQPVTVFLTGAELFYSSVGEGTVTTDGESFLAFGGGIGVCVRFFF